MRILIAALFIFSVITAPFAQAALPIFDSQGNSLPSLAPMLEKVTPAVVNIATHGYERVRENPLFQDPFFRRFFNVPDHPRRRETQSLGSGVVVDAEKGYILTNNHVIDKADEITVTLTDGRNLSAKLVGTDPDADVAVIQVKADKLTALPVADSEKLRVGDFVIAIGNPFGLGQTVTSGIVSALGRSGLGIEGYEDFIQTDASINPGNSGGALVNLRGELIGINTAIIAPSGGNVGIGFAIPINMVRNVMDQLIAYGEVRRGYLGVVVQDLTPELANAFGLDNNRGVVVAQVVPGSAAAKAGLKAGDVVFSIDGHKVRNAANLRNRVGMLRVGEKIEMDIKRENKVLTLNVVIDKPHQKTLKGERVYSRLEGSEFGEIEQGSPLYGHVEGVLVADVQPSSPAWSAGLRKDDIVVSANRVAVKSLDDLEHAAKRSNRGILLNIQRGDAALFLLVQ